MTPRPRPGWLPARGTPTNRTRRRPPRVTGATAPRLTGVPRGSTFRTRRSPRATRVPPAVRAPSTRRPRACWCGSPGSRRWRRRSTSCRNCVAICAARSSPRPRPKRRATTKYDATAGSMIGLLKYGSGLPFNRLDGLQGHLGVPLPASTQWDIVQAVAANLAPAFEELIRQAAQGEVLHNDDTTVKILELMGQRGRQEARADAAADADVAERARPVHLGRGRAARRPPGGAVLQRPPARGREPGPGAQAPRRGVAAADPDVRCPVAQPAGRAADDPGALPGPCPAAVRRCLRSFSRAVPPPPRIAGRGLSQRRHRAGATAVARGASAVSPGSEPADDARTARLADAATGREVDRAQFGPGRRDRLHAQALGSADVVPASGRCPAGQQRVRAGLEEGDPAPQERPVLQDPERRPRRRPVHEPDLHLPVEPGQPVRLPDPVAAARRRARGQPRALDAVELPRGAAGRNIRSQGELTITPRPRAPFGSYRAPKEGQSSGRARLLRAAEFTRGATPALRGQGLG